MSYNLEFTITGPLTVEEASVGRKVLSGTIVRLDSVTSNSREYQWDEAPTIAERLIGLPVHFGMKIVMDETGLKRRHRKDPDDTIGKIIKTWIDDKIKAIKGLVEIWNTEKNPTIVDEVKSGWGFSISGMTLANYVM